MCSRWNKELWLWIDHWVTRKCYLCGDSGPNRQAAPLKSVPLFSVVLDTYTHTYIHTNTHIYISIHTYIHTYIHVHPYQHTYTHMYLYVFAHTYTQLRKHTYICTVALSLDREAKRE